MNIVASQVGIDVSKGELVISVDKGKPFTATNSKQGALRIARQLPKGSIVHIESTGGYERVAVSVLKELGFDVRVHNPLRVRRLAEGIGPKAKTDPIDAMMLSATGNLLPERKAKSEERKALADFSRAIDNVKNTSADYKKRAKMPGLDPDAKQAYKAVVRELDKLSKALEKQFVTRMSKSCSQAQYELARSVRFIGPVAARVCVCELPEDMPERTRAQMSSYSGLAPMNRSSGTFNPPARIARGNKRMKRGLYMAAIAAISHDPKALSVYRAHLAKGKTHEQAIVPIMRKLLVKVVTVLQRGTPWKDAPPTT